MILSRSCCFGPLPTQMAIYIGPLTLSKCSSSPPLWSIRLEGGGEMAIYIGPDDVHNNDNIKLIIIAHVFMFLKLYPNDGLI